MISNGSYPILPNRIGAIDPYIYGLARELAKTNQVSVYGIGKGVSNQGNLHIFGIPIQNLQQSLSKRIDWRIGYYGPFNTVTLVKILHSFVREQVDIIHIHDVFTGFAASISKRVLGIPYVCSIHNEIRSALPIRSCNKILAVSGYIKNHLINERAIPKNKIDILNIAIDPDLYQFYGTSDQAKAELGLAGRKVILFIGRKCPEKGPQVLIDAIPQIKNKYPEVIAIIAGPDFVFGSDSSLYSQSLTAQAQKLRVSNNISIRGYITNATKQKLLHAADIVVFPSIWREPAGIVLLEAMASKKPVIASNVGGISDFVRQGISGLVIPPNNPREITIAVDSLLGDSAYARELGELGRDIVLEKFSFSKVSKKAYSIYKNILENS